MAAGQHPRQLNNQSMPTLPHKKSLIISDKAQIVGQKVAPILDSGQMPDFPALTASPPAQKSQLSFVEAVRGIAQSKQKESSAQISAPFEELATPITELHGKPAVLFPIVHKSELVANLKYVLVGKFSHGRPNWSSINKFFQDLELQGSCNVSIYDNKHIFIECCCKTDFDRLWLHLSWFIDGYTMRMFKWGPDFNPLKESTIAPVWIRLVGIPLHLFEERYLWQISKIFGTPIKLDPRNVNRSMLNQARVCIQLDIAKPLVESCWVGFAESTGEVVESHCVKVFYDELPSFCTTCDHIGHKVELCKRNQSAGAGKESLQEAIIPKALNLVQASTSASIGNHSTKKAQGKTQVWKAAGKRIPIVSQNSDTNLSRKNDKNRFANLQEQELANQNADVVVATDSVVSSEADKYRLADDGKVDNNYNNKAIVVWEGQNGVEQQPPFNIDVEVLPAAVSSNLTRDIAECSAGTDKTKHHQITPELLLRKELMEHSMAQGGIVEVVSKKSDLLENLEEHGENVSSTDVARTQQSSLASNCTNNNLVATKITTNVQNNEVNESSQVTVASSKELMQIPSYDAGNAADLGVRMSDCTKSESKNEVSFAAGSQCQKRAALSGQNIEGSTSYIVEPTTLEDAKCLVVWEGHDVVAASSFATDERVSPTVTGEFDAGVISMEVNQGTCSTYDSSEKPQLTDPRSSGLEDKSDWQMVTRNKNKRPIKTQARTIVVCEDSEEPSEATSTKKAELQVVVVPYKSEADHHATPTRTDTDHQALPHTPTTSTIAQVDNTFEELTPTKARQYVGQKNYKVQGAVTRAQTNSSNFTWADQVEEEQLATLSRKQLDRKISKLASRINNMGLKHALRGQLLAEMEALHQHFTKRFPPKKSKEYQS